MCKRSRLFARLGRLAQRSRCCVSALTQTHCKHSCALFALRQRGPVRRGEAQGQ